MFQRQVKEHPLQRPQRKIMAGGHTFQGVRQGLLIQRKTPRIAAVDIAGKLVRDDDPCQPAGRLAWIIVADQFSRNIYRCDPRSFALDEQALAHALEGMAAGHDLALRPLQRVFFYLPLEHSESIELQQQSVMLYEGLLNEVGEKLAQPFTGFLDYARRHLDVIQRFGRFPHRNAILGRESTAAEIEYLQQPGSGF